MVARRRSFHALPMEREVHLTLQNAAGLTDRATIIAWLLDVATLLDAKPYIEGSPRQSLSTRHSPLVAPHWNHYLVAGSTHNPFASPPPREGPCDGLASCKQLWSYVQRQKRRWTCLHVHFSPFECSGLLAPGYTSDADPSGMCGIRTEIAARGLVPTCMSLSHTIISAYHRVREHLQSSSYAYAHVRRGDKEQFNAQCTSPAAIVARMVDCVGQERKRGWIVGVAEDPTKIVAYQAELRSAASRQGLNIIFEDEALAALTATTAGNVSTDNFVRFAVSQLLMRDAVLQIETHYCSVAMTHACHVTPQLLGAFGSDGEHGVCQRPRTSSAAPGGTRPSTASELGAVQCACAHAGNSPDAKEQHNACKHWGKHLQVLMGSERAPSVQRRELEWILEAQVWAKTLGLAMWAPSSASPLQPPQQVTHPPVAKKAAAGPVLHTDVVCSLLSNMTRRGGPQGTIQPMPPPSRFLAACAAPLRDRLLSPVILDGPGPT